VDNSPRSPLWSYKLGLDNGWIPQNPRDALVRFSVFNAYQFGLNQAVIYRVHALPKALYKIHLSTARTKRIKQAAQAQVQ